jgi:hypothetical protein
LDDIFWIDPRRGRPRSDARAKKSAKTKAISGPFHAPRAIGTSLAFFEVPSAR